MKIKYKQEEIIFSILIAVSAIYFIIGFLFGFDKDEKCNDHAIWVVKQSEIKGILISKEKHCIHDNLDIIVKQDDEAIEHFIGFPFACMFDYVEPNDSIIKIKNKLDYVVIRNGNERVFSMDCNHDCSCSRVP